MRFLTIDRGLAALGVIACMTVPLAAARADTVASLLGNFTINQFSEVTLGPHIIDIHQAVVFGQLPALRELHAADTDGNGVTSQAERDAYIGTLAPRLGDSLVVTVDGRRVPLHPIRWTSSLPTEQGGFSLRADVYFSAPLPALAKGRHTLQFTNENYGGQVGWHEITVRSAAPVAIFDTNAYGDSATGGLTEALQSLPASGPLDERAIHLRFDESGLPAGAVPLGLRSGPVRVAAPVRTASSSLIAGEAVWISAKTRLLVESISGPRIDAAVMTWALLAALLLGAVHALSPGHGKTIVGAYLIGSRGTPRHALFLALTVTVTHTLGVFVLGFATLYASRYVMPERLFPVLSLISALLVLGMGVVLLVERSRNARRALRPAGSAPVFVAVAQPVAYTRGRLLAPAGAQVLDGTLHSHGGKLHSHLPPGAAGEKVTWRSLLTLGISGGLVPCPSAMVLLLAAIALNKTAFGMLLVLIFSVGLAITLAAVGLVFLYARNRFGKPAASARWPYLVPVASATTITVLGLVLAVGAIESFT